MLFGRSHNSATMATSTSMLETVALNHSATIESLAKGSVKISRHVLAIEEEHRLNHFTRSTLAQAAMLGPNTIVINDDESGCLLAFYHLGHKIAGHVGIVHGGLSATILDECMGRACFPLLPGRIGVTAKLDLQFRSPIKVDSMILVRANTTKTEGRKAWVEATIETMEGELLVQATAMFIEPKWSANLSPMMG